MLYLLASLLALPQATATGNTHAQNARAMVHNLTYGVLSTTSQEFGGVAFGNPQSFVDGTTANSTGNLYFYVSDLDASMVDIAVNPNASFTLSEEMIDDYCSQQGVDPEDPRCIRVVLMGEMKEVDSEDLTWAKDALFARHPAMKSWPADHSWKVFSMSLKNIWVIDMFGGASVVSLSDYFSAAPAALPALAPTVSPAPSGVSPPLFFEKAKTARWLAHTLSYGVLSTTSTVFDGSAFGNPQSFSDGAVDNSTGHLYFYMSYLDASIQDITKNSSCSWTLSEQMVNNFCTQRSSLNPQGGGDAEDPRCTRLTFIGKMQNVTDPNMLQAAQAALFPRHPEMKTWPSDHMFKFYTMEIEHIWLIDMFGGASSIKPSDYYSTSP